MIVKLLTEYHFGFLSLKGGRTGSSESTHVKMPHCWKSHTLAQIYFVNASSQFSKYNQHNVKWPSIIAIFSLIEPLIKPWYF